MVTYSTSDFKVGLKIIIDNDPCVIIEEEFNKPGKGQAFSKIKFRNYLTGRVGEKTCKVGESLQAADVEELDMQFLYSDGNTWFFMHPDTYEQVPVNTEILGELESFNNSVIKQRSSVQNSFNGFFFLIDLDGHIFFTKLWNQPLK